MHGVGMDMTYALLKHLYGSSITDKMMNNIEYAPHTDPEWDPFSVVHNVCHSLKFCVAYILLSRASSGSWSQHKSHAHRLQGASWIYPSPIVNCIHNVMTIYLLLFVHITVILPRWPTQQQSPRDGADK
jgi:hypothetical protein